MFGWAGVRTARVIIVSHIHQEQILAGRVNRSGGDHTASDKHAQLAINRLTSEKAMLSNQHLYDW